MDDELWDVALPSGEVKRMSLDQLDRAFQVGLIHSNTLVREGGTSEWQALGVVAGLDEEPETVEPSTTRAGDGRGSVLPAPPEDEDPQRETLAGLGGFLAVGPAGSYGGAPPAGSYPPPQRAATLPMGSAPAPVVVSSAAPAAATGARPPPLPVNAFGPVATVTRSVAPSQPTNALAPQTSAAPAPVQPSATGSAAPPVGSAPPRARPSASPAIGSAPPPPPRKSSGPPPIPAGAFSPSQRPPPAAPAPQFSSSQPPVQAAPAAALEPAPRLTPRAGKGAGLANGFIFAFALLTLLVILHRNGLLFELGSKLGMAAAYEDFESRVLGSPSLLTPRGVQRLEARAQGGGSAAAPSAVPTATP